MIVNIITSLESYGSEFVESIYKNDGTKTLKGLDFNDIETGIPTATRYIYIRHDGLEPIYNVGFYIKPVGTNWGGYVSSRADTTLPYNPNFFRSGGVFENGSPTTSSLDYNFIREMAFNNPDMGCRLHLVRNDIYSKANSLGFNNVGISITPLAMPTTCLDYSRTSSAQLSGTLYPEPTDQSKYGKVGDEAKVGISLSFPEEVVGSGHVQFALAIKYRYTA